MGGFAVLCPKADHSMLSAQSHLNTVVTPSIALAAKQADTYRSGEWQGTTPGRSLMT